LRTGVAGSRYVGNSPAFTVVWNATRRLTLLASYVHFFPGDYFRVNPPDRNVDYFAAWLDYKF
jgi:hypothetical protein